MEKFLVASKNCLINANDYQQILVVLGNPTCDLDSAVCALAKGYLEYREQAVSRITGVIPVLNVTRDEFRLRTEVVYYLKRCGVPRDLLTFRDEINLEELRASEKLQLIMVDYHALPEEDVQLADSVIEVIDHRPQDASWPWSGRRLCLQLVGSCATLVAQQILQRCPDILTELACLLKGPILVDTVNLSREAARATPLDHEIMERLEQATTARTTASGRSLVEKNEETMDERTRVYRDILAAKTDISELTPGDLLIRDMKVANGIPIPGFPILVKDFMELEGAMEALDAFCVSRNYRLVVLIGLDLKEDKVTRDIAVYSLLPDQATDKLIEALLTAERPSSLQLTESGRVQRGQNLLLHYHQANARASRKQILPIIQSAAAATDECK
ncbi:exopolyphosphatase PRUNE1 [Phymastichus coffea]|uniref:exopolyphosphatase PRUNE1 n=1 Tax=Phymastichus coffea TaxID=108790 RepID=UPI00273B585B|nr:exopolyphosphatase PRUNE1 [Phymastichus coffea]